MWEKLPLMVLLVMPLYTDVQTYNNVERYNNFFQKSSTGNRKPNCNIEAHAASMRLFYPIHWQFIVHRNLIRFERVLPFHPLWWLSVQGIVLLKPKDGVLTPAAASVFLMDLKKGKCQCSWILALLKIHRWSKSIQSHPLRHALQPPDVAFHVQPPKLKKKKDSAVRDIAFKGTLK